LKIYQLNGKAKRERDPGGEKVEIMSERRSNESESKRKCKKKEDFLHFFARQEKEEDFLHFFARQEKKAFFENFLHGKKKNAYFNFFTRQPISECAYIFFQSTCP